jgi:hypothetical protein
MHKNLKLKLCGNAVLRNFYVEGNEYYAYLDTIIPPCNNRRRKLSLLCKVSDKEFIAKLSKIAGTSQNPRLRYVVEYEMHGIKPNGNHIESCKENEEDISRYHRLEITCNLIDFDNISFRDKNPSFI